MKPHVLFLVPYPPGRAPSQRFRVENFLFLLDDAGIPYKMASFIDEATWKILYQPGHTVKKALGIVKGFFKRWGTVLGAGKYDFVYVHREAAPLGPPVFEWFLAKVMRKKLIYDYDDAIWLGSTSKENKIAAALKSPSKVAKNIRYSYKVVGGNDYLCNYARSNGGKNVIKIPTVVDTEHRYNKIKSGSGSPVTIGWTGSHSTLKYIDELIPVLQRLEKEHEFTFLVIADKQPALPLKNCQFVPWNSVTEIDDLLKIDIGVMPLTNDRWSEGKCGFKIIQYLSVGIPAVASPVGVNSQIIEAGKSGYLCETDAEWEAALNQLLASETLRKQMGAEGRKKMVAEYSIASQSKAFVDLFS